MTFEPNPWSAAPGELPYDRCNDCGEYPCVCESDYERDEPDLGPCCACEKEDKTVRNIVMMDRRTSVPGTGWGCFVCGLPAEGASYVLCDSCLETGREPKYAICGYPVARKRVLISELPPGEFHHDETKRH